jgi:hypothetical protein
LYRANREDVLPAAEIVRGMVREAEAALERAAG